MGAWKSTGQNVFFDLFPSCGVCWRGTCLFVGMPADFGFAYGQYPVYCCGSNPIRLFLFTFKSRLGLLPVFPVVLVARHKNCGKTKASSVSIGLDAAERGGKIFFWASCVSNHRQGKAEVVAKLFVMNWLLGGHL